MICLLLLIQVAPHFVKPLIDVAVEEGVVKEVTLEAEFSVKNPRTIKWLRVCLHIFGSLYMISL